MFQDALVIHPSRSRIALEVRDPDDTGREPGPNLKLAAHGFDHPPQIADVHIRPSFHPRYGRRGRGFVSRKTDR